MSSVGPTRSLTKNENGFLRNAHSEQFGTALLQQQKLVSVLGRKLPISKTNSPSCPQWEEGTFCLSLSEQPDTGASARIMVSSSLHGTQED